MRSFVIAQVSDLHLDGAKTLKGAVDVLVAALAERMHEFRYVPTRILLITGDLIESPGKEAFAEAKEFLDRVKAMPDFTDVYLIAGNHDVKIKGLGVRMGDFHQRFGAPEESVSHYYEQAGLNLLLVDSNRANFAKGSVDDKAYNVLAAAASELNLEIIRLKDREKEQLKMRAVGAEQLAESDGSIIRVLALHHHPLPLAQGEGKSMLGVPDEPFMYLTSPATFLDSILSLDVTLILHGHRHVQGLTRYSVPNRLATTSQIDGEFWRTIYVLSCPSSTGKSCDAGFNLVHFTSAGNFGRTRFEFVVKRFTRTQNRARFEALDSLPAGIIHLPLGQDYHRDIAIQVEIELKHDTMIDRKKLIEYARRLITRRAFFNDLELSWPHALYAHLITYVVWTNVLLPAFLKHGFGRDQSDAQLASQLIWSLLEQAANVLGLRGGELDSLRHVPLADQEQFMRRLPTLPNGGINMGTENKARTETLSALDACLANLLGPLGLAQRPPAQLEE